MIKQLSIFAENRKGTLQKITGILDEHGINMIALITNDSAEFGIIRMLVDKPEEAEGIMGTAGFLTRLDSVIAVEIGDSCGSLNKLLVYVDDCNINVDYLYMSFNRELGTPIAVLKTPDSAEVESMVVARGYKVL